MIVRADHDHLLLITQPDHAALARTIMSAWQLDGLPLSPRRDTILLATHHHDDGWIEVDAAPLLDPSSGRVLDFMTAPDTVRQNIWPRGVERMTANPYAAALVAQHALAIYEPNRVYPEWAPFFEHMEQLRDRELRRAAPLTLDTLHRDYFFVRMGDLLSLTFCCGWREPRRHGAYEVRWTGSELTVHPDPFNGQSVELAISGRQLSRAALVNSQDVAALFRDAPVVTFSGQAVGS